MDLPTALSFVIVVVHLLIVSAIIWWVASVLELGPVVDRVDKVVTQFLLMNINYPWSSLLLFTY